MKPISSLAIGLLAAVLLASCGGDDGKPVQLNLLGNRADLVSDGDAMVEVQLPPGANSRTLKVAVNGTNQTDVFVERDGRLVGLLTNLQVGKNVVEVSANDARTTRLQITNASRGGPIISGPQQGPFYCATVTPQPGSDLTPATLASGLSTEAYDAQCNIKSEFKLYYRTTATGCSFALPGSNPSTCFKPYDPSVTAPVDLATTTTDTGLTVPYVVRVERGTMNRGIYDIAVLVDPSKPWDRGTETHPTWNGKVNFLFGGAGSQPRRQMASAENWTDDKSLSRGWMVAVNSMTDGSRNNNRVVTAETVMMMKEHIVDRYGEVRFTIASGCSAGSTNAMTVNSVHPGLLDGAIISCALLDFETVSSENFECGLLVDAFDRAPWKNAMTAGGYTQADINAKKAAIAGAKTHSVCQTWFNAFGRQRFNGNNTIAYSANSTTGAISTSPINPPTNNCQLPPAAVWDPVTNPTGVRCGAWDWMASLYGKLPDGTANTTRDTTGIQYGLTALRESRITPEEFVALNETVGGLSREGVVTAERTVADISALETAYRTGMVLESSLGTLALIDLRGADDLHQNWRSFALRARMEQAYGHHDNHAMWRYPGASGTRPTGMDVTALLEMDKWLTTLKADKSNRKLLQKIVSAKPPTALDYCLLSTDPTGTEKVTDSAACDADPVLAPDASPRQAAGGPRGENVLKCQIKPLDVADYAPAVLSGTQLQRLQAVFPNGVCDWSLPGLGQQSTGDVPYTFMGGPGGQPLPPVPVATY